MRIFPVLALAVTAAAPLAAQVGFMPSQSPYHAIQRGTFVEALGGRIFGTGGLLLLGPRDGDEEGVRFVLRGKNTLQFSFGGWTAGTVRSVIDADDSVATRNKGLFHQQLIAGEIGIQLNLSGGKTWHGVAPFAGVNFGFLHGQSGPATDTSGYSFGTKVYFGPAAGARLFISQRLYLRLEARGLFWNLQYPASYSLEPSKQPGTLTAPNAVNPTGVSSQYTLTPEIRIGLGFSWW
ncbi:MAG TPA: hypothetical protein VGL65_01235 [Gemmatimonadales bacterium]|jgi:hypothetical protein